MAGSQTLNFAQYRSLISIATMICLAYIMIEVGLEFTIDKKNLKRYAWDYVVAATAAAFPWVFCAVYFIVVFHTDWREALLIGRFAAPTSAGVLFAMLAAAGLGATWLFKKAQVLAIFDDLDTILLMIPLQFLFVGAKPELFWIVLIILFLLFAAYKWLHAVHLPVSQIWMLVYGAAIVFLCRWIEKATHIHIEILLPAFALGCILYEPHGSKKEEKHEKAYLEPSGGIQLMMDKGIKISFMLLVGLSLPKIELASQSIGVIAWHVFIITVLSNLGKCFPAFCYRKEATFRERLALSVAMFPRGEVGAGVLLVALNYGLRGLPTTLSALSLALNLLLTGVFILVVIRLISKKSKL